MSAGSVPMQRLRAPVAVARPKSAALLPLLLLPLPLQVPVVPLRAAVFLLLLPLVTRSCRRPLPRITLIW